MDRIARRQTNPRALSDGRVHNEMCRSVKAMDLVWSELRDLANETDSATIAPTCNGIELPRGWRDHAIAAIQTKNAAIYRFLPPINREMV